MILRLTWLSTRSGAPGSEVLDMDAEVSARLAAFIEREREPITAEWTRLVREMMRGRLTSAELDRQIAELYGELLSALSVGVTSTTDAGAAGLMGALADLSRARARHGFSATETAVSVFAVKEATFAALPNKDADTLADFSAFSLFVDKLGLYTFEMYAGAREGVIAEQTEQLLELSTPVVKLWDGVVAVPLIGTLDSARSQVVMERLLQALVDTGSPWAILDITGVPAVDTQVAQHILKTVVAAQLMGAQCIISGIRPQIAQTIVSLGIEFGEIVTKATLADALRYALRASGVEVARRPSRAAL